MNEKPKDMMRLSSCMDKDNEKNKIRTNGKTFMTNLPIFYDNSMAPRKITQDVGYHECAQHENALLKIQNFQRMSKNEVKMNLYQVDPSYSCQQDDLQLKNFEWKENLSNL